MPQYSDDTLDSMNHQLEQEDPCSHHQEEGTHEPKRSASLNVNKTTNDTYDSYSLGYIPKVKSSGLSTTRTWKTI